MRKMMKVSMGKYQSDDSRWLTYNFDFKTEEFADRFMDALERKFEEFDYDWKFARCPEITDDGMYIDCVDIPYENGLMNEYKKDMRTMVDEVKAEMGIK